MDLTEAKLAFLDVETTGLSPAMGDRIVEIGIVECRGQDQVGQLSRLVNPGLPIPPAAHRVHGISDQEVADEPTFGALASDVVTALQDAWIVGHNVRFDIGFVGMEIAAAGHQACPLGCFDTCQLAKATWGLPNYQLQTVVASLGLRAGRQHRALEDAQSARDVFDRVVDEMGGWADVTLADMQALHSYVPAWPEDPRRDLPSPLYDALANGQELAIRYVNGDGQASERTIRPVACFPAGRYTYLRAHCTQAGEMRTFRLDRMIVE